MSFCEPKEASAALLKSRSSYRLDIDVPVLRPDLEKHYQVRSRVFEDGEHLFGSSELVMLHENLLRSFAIEDVHVAYTLVIDDDIRYCKLGFSHYAA